MQLKSMYLNHKRITFPKIPIISDALKSVLTKMCLVDKFKRPLVQDLLKDQDYLKLINMGDSQLEKIKKEKNKLTQSIQIFNEQARNKGKKRQKYKKLIIEAFKEESTGDELQTPSLHPVKSKFCEGLFIGSATQIFFDTEVLE